MAPSPRESAPVFVPTSPNFTVDHLGKHSAYVGELSRKYKALTQQVREEPPSPPHLLSEGQEGRISALRQRIQDAWVNADGNPADGKWASVTRLVRMGSISGRNGRWIGSRTDVQSAPQPDNGSGWLNTDSQAEWKEWEKKYQEERKLKDKVENWKKKLMSVSPAVSKESVNITAKAATSTQAPNTLTTMPPPSNSKAAAKATPAVFNDPLKTSNSLGFRVVKRSSQVTTANGKPPPPTASTSKQKHSTQDVDRLVVAPATNIQDISDIPDLSFLPPAFATSTPKPTKQPQTRAESATSSPLPELTSSIRPPSPQTIDARPQSPGTRPRISASLPAIPTFNANVSKATPTTEVFDNLNQLNANNKRPLPGWESLPTADADDHQAKKPRVTSEDEVASALQKPLSSESHSSKQPQNPITPTRDSTKKSLPTLTELLASAKASKRTKIKPVEALDETHSKTTPSTGNPANAEEQIINPSPYDFNPFAADPPVLEQDNRDQSPNMPLSVDPHINVDEDLLLASVDQLEYDLTSPSKSLSSLAGSEEEDELEDDDALPTVEADGDASGDKLKFNLDSSFRPLATSTQVQRGPFVSKANLDPLSQQQPQPHGESVEVVDSWESIYASAKPASHPIHPVPITQSSATSSKNFFAPSSSNSKPSFLIYNSQFDRAIDAQIDQVDKLLEKDVDFDKWVKDPYAGEDEDKSDDEERSDDERNGDLRAGTGYSVNSSLKGGFGQNGSNYGYGKAYEYDESR